MVGRECVVWFEYLHSYMLVELKNKTGLTWPDKWTPDLSNFLICLCLDFRMRVCEWWNMFRIKFWKLQINVNTKIMVHFCYRNRKNVRRILTHSLRKLKMNFRNWISVRSCRTRRTHSENTKIHFMRVFLFARIFWMRSLQFPKIPNAKRIFFS